VIRPARGPGDPPPTGAAWPEAGPRGPPPASSSTNALDFAGAEGLAGWCRPAPTGGRAPAPRRKPLGPSYRGGAVRAARPAAPAAALALAKLLAPEAVVFFPETAEKVEVMERPGRGASGSFRLRSTSTVLRGLVLRRRDGSTSLEEGFRLPHVTLRRPRPSRASSPWEVPRQGVHGSRAWPGRRSPRSSSSSSRRPARRRAWRYSRGPRGSFSDDSRQPVAEEEDRGAGVALVAGLAAPLGRIDLKNASSPRRRRRSARTKGGDDRGACRKGVEDEGGEGEPPAETSSSHRQPMARRGPRRAAKSIASTRGRSGSSKKRSTPAMADRGGSPTNRTRCIVSGSPRIISTGTADRLLLSIEMRQETSRRK